MITPKWRSPLAAVRPAPSAESAEVRELWLALRPMTWRTLAVVPLSRQDSLAKELWSVARWAGGGEVSLLDATRATPSEVAALEAELGARAGRGERVLVGVGLALAEPASLAVALATDAALLCVTLGADRLRDTQRAVELLGRERVVGCVAFG